MTNQNKLTKLIFFSLCPIILFPFQMHAHFPIHQSLPSKNSCDFYIYQEKIRNCGKRGYLLHFGHYYCERFKDAQKSYPPKAQKWANEVRYCLQEKMNHFPLEINCTTLRSWAFYTHPSCYQLTGFCQLPFKSKKLIFNEIRKKTLFHPRIVKMALSMFKKCLFTP